MKYQDKLIKAMDDSDKGIIKEIAERIIIKHGLPALLEIVSKMSVLHIGRLFEAIFTNSSTIQTIPEKPADIETILIDYPTFNPGGIQRILGCYEQILLDQGYKVIHIYNTKSKTEYKKVVGVQYILLRNYKGKTRNYWQKVIDIIRKNKVDVYWSHDMYSHTSFLAPILLGRYLGCYSVMTMHTFAMRFFRGDPSNIYLQSLIGKYYDQVCILDRVSLQFWQRLGFSTMLMPNPLHLGMVTKPRVLDTNKSLKLLWVGHLLQEAKYIFELPRISAELNKLNIKHKLTMLGSPVGSVKYDVKKIIVELTKKYNVVECIEIAEETLEPEAYYSEADIFINTSIVEGFPLVLSEASAFALPIVMYDLPYLLLVQNAAGFGIQTAPFKDASGLAAIIAKIANDPNEYTEQSKAALNNIKKYARDFNGKKMVEELFTRLTRQRPAKPTESNPYYDEILSKELLKLNYEFANNNGIRSKVVNVDEFWYDG